ncbi:KI20B protein, partial [Geococcyx californianus]|nr:KI20B protein [Geococcyx californianus]
MELASGYASFYTQSHVADVGLRQRIGQIYVEDIKTDLSAELTSLASNSDTSQSKEHIQVCLRIRPFTSLEKENEMQECVSIEDSTSIVLKHPKNSLSQLSEKSAGQMQKFTFSQVFGPEATQEEFFEGTMKQPVQDFIDGHNRLIFTYGVTNSGKTYTIQGTEDNLGILPRTMDLLFKSIQRNLYTAMDFKPHRFRDYIKLTKDQVREETAIKNSILRLTKETHSTSAILTCSILYLADSEELSEDLEQSSTTMKNYIKFSVWISFFEIYNDYFYDLLIPISNDKKRKTLRLAQDVKGFSYLKDLHWIQISDSKEAFRLLKLGLKHQSFASTKMNTCSSRSHTIFTVKLLKIEDAGVPRVTQVNELIICDLAGSERYTKTRNEGDRLKESGNINTSLLTLGKCINALKNCQRSKLRQHVPFRESKLTHFLQGYFNGKGKVYMIVNINQCASVYDETLNALKFSAIAQKVLLTNASVLPGDQSYGQKSAGESSLHSGGKMPVSRGRDTILWDRSLEDVIEDTDGEMEEEHNTSKEEAVQKCEEVLIPKEKYMVCARATLRMLALIEELKNDLIAEKKKNYLQEQKIRDEMTDEFAQYLAEQDIFYRECLSRQREQLEENCDRRLEIFKELVTDCTEDADEEDIKDQPCKHSSGPGTHIGLHGFIDSVHCDVIDIKKQLKVAEAYLVSLEAQQEAKCGLEKQLGEVTAELRKTKEELTQKTKGELDACIMQKTGKKKKKEITTSSQEVAKSCQSKDCEETALKVRGKRCFENKPAVEEEPPRKKGIISTNTQQTQDGTEHVKSNTSENYAEILALRERAESLGGKLAALEEQCRRENEKKEELCGQITNLHLKLSASEEQASGLSVELEQCRADYWEVVSELSKQKTINREQEEKIIQLSNEVEDANKNIIDKVSQIKTMQTKVNELYKCQFESYAMDIDLVNVKDSLNSQKDEPERAQVSSVCVQPQTASTADLRQESSFHCIIESIWEECKNMVTASSQKSQRIKELLEEVEGLKRRLDDTENYNSQLKIKLNEIANQDQQSIKEEDIMNQLQAQIQKKTEDFEKQTAEDHRVIAQLEEEVSIYKGKIRELECLLEAFRAKDDDITKLKVLKEKESIILNLESNIVALQEKCVNSDEKLKELNYQKTILKEEVAQLMNSLEKMKHTLQEKEKKEDEQTQSVELLRKDLSESCSLAQSLKKDLERKEEEYTELKERYCDAKKQIQQVQKQVCTMQSEEKTLRKKVNELQRMQNQFKEELENKQRTILQLKKEQLNNEKLEEISKQYEKTRKDLHAKEKIIEDMQMTLEEQENTQTEQDQALEAKLEENNRLILELEALKQKYTELSNQSNCDWQQKMSKNEKKNENEELIKLQKELKENEAKCQTDRKQWLEEKAGFINQIKEAENLHNREMRKFAENKERLVEQQAEIERLAAQLVEKDSDLQKWREEKDKLVEVLEVQLKTLACKVMQKDKEIVELKQAALKDSEKELKQHFNHRSPKSLAGVPLPEEGRDKIDQFVNEEDHSEIVLDSSEESTENEKNSRFPKPEVEIQFTPLQPKKIVVKHQGSFLPVTVKMIKPRNKRKMEEMDEDFVKSADKKNAEPATPSSPSPSNKQMVWFCSIFELSTTKSFRKEYLLRKQGCASSKTSAKKKDVTLQKIGDILQSSPSIIHSKAKKLIAKITSPTSAETEDVKENELKPKRAKRKLYSRNISSPLDIPAAPVKEREKESDHLTIKRQLRPRQAK